MRRGHVRALTLTEVLVAGAAVGLLFTLIVPALHAAGGRSRSDVCLSNLEALGLAVRMYAEDQGCLPGPLHYAVSHIPDANDPYTTYLRSRVLTYKLRAVLGDTITDRLATCPVMEGINPDTNFAAYYAQTGRLVYPAHYAMNNWGNLNPPDMTGAVRATRPEFYFGYSAPPGTENDPTEIAYMSRYPAQPMGQVNRPAEEWMIADAWYRGRSSPGVGELQQEGPFQSAWTGEALPNFAPHQRRDTGGYTYTSSRSSDSAAIRSRKSDGVTNTVFFDGHAAGVPSKSFVLYATDILYGFPGTVNPLMESPRPSSPYWRAIWR